MSRDDGPLGRPVQLLTISAWPLVTPSGRARETIRHHCDPVRPRSRDYPSPRGKQPSSPDPIGPAVSRPAALARLSVTTVTPRGELPSDPVLSWSGPAEPLVGGHPGLPRSRDYPSPRGELPSSPDPIGPAVSLPAALKRLSVATRRKLPQGESLRPATWTLINDSDGMRSDPPPRSLRACVLGGVTFASCSAAGLGLIPRHYPLSYPS
jgi:hypothetical protein